MTKEMMLDLRNKGITVQALADYLGVSVALLMFHTDFPTAESVPMIHDAIKALSNKCAVRSPLTDVADSLAPDRDGGYYWTIGDKIPVHDKLS